jgi:oligoribonuclease (3'-5' exoribonuclease)
MIINNPVNPTGKVYDREELMEIAKIVKEFDLIVLADEVQFILTNRFTRRCAMKKSLLNSLRYPGCLRERSQSVRSVRCLGLQVGRLVGYLDHQK